MYMDFENLALEQGIEDYYDAKEEKKRAYDEYEALLSEDDE